MGFPSSLALVEADPSWILSRAPPAAGTARRGQPGGDNNPRKRKGNLFLSLTNQRTPKATPGAQAEGSTRSMPEDFLPIELFQVIPSWQSLVSSLSLLIHPWVKPPHLPYLHLQGSSPSPGGKFSLSRKSRWSDVIKRSSMGFKWALGSLRPPAEADQVFLNQGIASSLCRGTDFSSICLSNSRAPRQAAAKSRIFMGKPI